MARALPRTSLGACMNSRFPIPTRRWFASAGQRGFADHREPAVASVPWGVIILVGVLAHRP